MAGRQRCRPAILRFRHDVSSAALVRNDDATHPLRGFEIFRIEAMLATPTTLAQPQ
jgi:hypothetical protein